MSAYRMMLTGRWLAAAAIVFLTSAEQVQACAVCFGDPESRMAKGAVAGVLFLVGVIGAVLITVACTGIRWIQRGRRLAQLESSSPPALSSDLP